MVAQVCSPQCSEIAQAALTMDSSSVQDLVLHFAKVGISAPFVQNRSMECLLESAKAVLRSTSLKLIHEAGALPVLVSYSNDGTSVKAKFQHEVSDLAGGTPRARPAGRFMSCLSRTPLSGTWTLQAWHIQPPWSGSQPPFGTAKQGTKRLLAKGSSCWWPETGAIEALLSSTLSLMEPCINF